MAMTNQLTVGADTKIMRVDADPSASPGVVAGIGSIAMYNNGVTGALYIKTGSAATAWSLFLIGLSSPPAAGQLYIGKTDGTLALATLTAGTGIQIVSADGSITVVNTNSPVKATATTTDATETLLASVATTTDSVEIIKALIVARRTGGSAGSSDDCATYERTVRVKNVAGTVTIFDPQSDYTSEDQIGWSVPIVVNGTHVEFHGIGAVNNNVSWAIQTTVVGLP